MQLFKFVDSFVERRQLKLKSLDLCVTLVHSDWIPNPLCSHDASPAVVTPS
jgi:hypothetical protein